MHAIVAAAGFREGSEEQDHARWASGTGGGVSVVAVPPWFFL